METETSLPARDCDCSCSMTGSNLMSQLGTRGRAAVVWLSFMGEVSWVGYEVFWILLVPWPSLLLSAVACLAIVGQALLEAWSAGWAMPEEWLHDVLQAWWLVFSAAWALAEVFWDSPDNQTPWNLTPMLEENDEMYQKLNSICVMGFFAGPAVWLLTILGFLLSHLVSKRTGTSSTGSDTSAGAFAVHRARRRGGLFLAWTIFHRCAYVVCWSLMDALWAAGWGWSSEFFALLTFPAIVLAAYVETGQGLRGLDRTDLVLFLWTLSNFFWILGELFFEDDLNIRYLAAVVGALATLTLASSFRYVQRRLGLRKRRDRVLAEAEPNQHSASFLNAC